MANNSLKWLALLGGLAVGSASLAHAQDSGPLIDALVKKGVLTDQEGEDLRVDLQKDFANTSAGKLSVSSALTELKFFGDARVRYEYRSGENGAVDDQLERNRFRYRLRFGATGKFGDGWFFGSRLETAAGSRSTNVTTGNTTAPFSKNADSTIYVGQAYLGRTINDFTFTGGRFANPLVTTPMMWDDDINIEGLAEQWNHTTGNTTWIVNLGQYVYEGSGTTNPFGATASQQSTQLLAFQGGAKFKVGPGSLQILPTYYHYTGNGPATMGALTTPMSATLRPVGLSIVDIPLEYAFKIGNLPAKVWGDYAVNLDADERAAAAGVPASDGEDTAWQVGFALGQTKAKGDWEARVFYQQVDAFALDSNLVDSDLFDSRTNMEGYGVSFSYVLSNGVTAKLTYAEGDRKNDSLATYGAGDIGAANLTNYKLFQADISVKF